MSLLLARISRCSRWSADVPSARDDHTEMLFRDRGYLPHIESAESIYFITFRLADSLPANLLESWRAEHQEIISNAKSQNRNLTDYEEKRLKFLYLERIEKYLDLGKGNTFLSRPEVADMVVNALKYFDGDRYHLYTWCVMPNHVHVLFSPIRQDIHSSNDSLLIPILHSWKSFTAKEANKILKREGKFWQEEYFDTIVRSNRQYAYYVHYILENPVKAGLCNSWHDWRWSGCSEKILNLLEGKGGGRDARAPADEN